MALKKPVVAVMMGSDSDLAVMSEASRILDEYAVPYRMMIMSAHRTPDDVTRFARSARSRGIRAVIAGAGGAAHLAGVVAAHTTLPVIGVPLDAGGLGGLDALLSTVQMPGGIPVATVAIGKAGARNAALLAVRILAVTDRQLEAKLAAARERMAADVRKKNAALAR